MQEEHNEMTSKTFGYPCPPPPHHHCGAPVELTTHDWMHYINSYIDVRARQIYDKLKGLANGQENVIESIKVNNATVPVDNKVANITIDVPRTSNDLPFDYTGISTHDMLTRKVDQEQGKGLSTNDFTDELSSKLASLKNYDEDIADIKESITKNGVVLVDSGTNKKYKVFFQDGVLCSEEVHS